MSSNPRTDTFLFTDLENSTPLWENHPEKMQALSSRHDALIRQAVEAHRGRVVKTTGDGFHAVFDTATDGVAAALAGQQAIIAEPWPAEIGPFRVRMGLHIGESRPRDGDYYGPDVNRAARVMGLAYGGQVLLSQATAVLVRSTLPPQTKLLDLGQHRLRGFAAPESIFQLQHPGLPFEFPPLRSLSVHGNNLPVQLSRFIGRQQELSDIKRLLNDTHLLTLLGPGGTGKTRLMLEVAEEVIGSYADGVWLVELAPLTDPDLIAERIASVLTVPEQSGRPLIDTLVDYLRRKELLLLLDNVEHLVRECAVLAEHLLLTCPKLRILVTGREALFISGEITLQIPSLSLPAGSEGAALEEIRSSEGVQLFLARAQDIQPDYELDPQNAVAIAEIVRRLDGIPFALELAAARLRMLSADQIAERLNDRFRLLTGGRRTALPRQQTLQAMIDWSWNLLDQRERLLLGRLSVFSGGWSLEAAQAVAGDEPLDEYDVFDLLEQLVNKSLVTVTYPVGSEARYSLLESIHQYGRDRLFASNEGIVLRDRHAAYFVAFAEKAEPHLVGAMMLPWSEKLKLELDNLRAVMVWTLEEQPELALHIGGALLYVENNWISPREAKSWLEPAIEATRPFLDKEESKVRVSDFVKALLGLAVAYSWLGETAARFQICEEAIQLARSHNQPRLLAMAICYKYIGAIFQLDSESMQDLEEAIAVGREYSFGRELIYALGIYALALLGQGQIEVTLPYFEEVLQVSRTIDNPRTNGVISNILALAAQMQGDLDQAERYRLRALEYYEVIGDPVGILLSQSELAHVLRAQGKIDEAETIYRQTVVGWQAFGQPTAVVHQIECFAYLAMARGENDRAAKLLGAAGIARQQLNAVSTEPREIADLARTMEKLAESLGAEKRDAALTEGSRLNLDDTVQRALN